MCNCKGTELVTGIVVLVLALWPALLGATASKWVLVAAAVILIIHSLGCKDMCGTTAAPKPAAKKKAKKKKR